ncbi:MAG: hypothetical protein AB1553_09430 [Nitrospirota bacterium]
MTYPKRPVLGGIIGAAVGIVAGSLIGTVYAQVREEQGGGIEYYSESSPLYEGSDEIGYM